ncbi:urease accessory protein UreD [Mangrovimicrobium sediminis]|uniref:Urease accessory protein UreD n=1 Tax=Mangrovimicrobium sediminis TaxID=2562682 RepID=A0A4Z0M606_9GAMM|nr:urease accessory protein UreD [Haliea sp. SAOS-164]
MVAPAAVAAGTWPASLELRLAAREGATRLVRCRHRGPLYVQRAFYPEGEEHAHLYLLHPPGGVVSGDALSVSVHCEHGTGALLTTPGAGRVYRARDTLPEQRQHTRLQVASGAALEWFPLETIVYDGACVDLLTEVELEEGARFIAWDVACLGLPGSAAPFTHGSFCQRYRVVRDGIPLFVDALQIDESNRRELLDGPAALRGNPVCGLFLAGPFAAPAEDSLWDELRALAEPGQAAISRVGDLAVGRYLGASAERARRQFSAWWQRLRPLLLGREACAPRIWLT